MPKNLPGSPAKVALILRFSTRISDKFLGGGGNRAQIVLLQASCIHQETQSVPWFGGFDGVARRYFKSAPYNNQ